MCVTPNNNLTDRLTNLAYYDLIAAHTSPGGYRDLSSQIGHRQRCAELRQLAEEEGISLPIPPQLIATLEMFGYVVDLKTGKWSAPAEYWPGPALAKAGQDDHAGSEEDQE